ncbi:hypothetical protein NEHOM01_0815 [Nematocida homosporus]|uniref:uncharacterized protein n=1 Tax=Nematocida homosporus TaxID=1912981 RepID=UPI00221F2D92|nr:uncharacterized protein NEHOM01_0815 [Nematocida homosporus]KAI5185400.1 hypothetical protein NEHOM01_0815 [Nematocida homosporus]
MQFKVRSLSILFAILALSMASASAPTDESSVAGTSAIPAETAMTPEGANHEGSNGDVRRDESPEEAPQRVSVKKRISSTFTRLTSCVRKQPRAAINPQDEQEDGPYSPTTDSSQPDNLQSQTSQDGTESPVDCSTGPVKPPRTQPPANANLTSQATHILQEGYDGEDESTGPSRQQNNPLYATIIPKHARVNGGEGVAQPMSAINQHYNPNLNGTAQHAPQGSSTPFDSDDETSDYTVTAPTIQGQTPSERTSQIPKPTTTRPASQAPPVYSRQPE